MVKAKIIDQYEIKNQKDDESLTQLTVEVIDNDVAKNLEILCNNIEQDFGKPRHSARIGETTVNCRSFKKHNRGPEIIFIIVFIGQEVATKIFKTEITTFCEES